MEELSPCIEFYNLLESIVDSRQRLVGEKSAQASPGMLNDVFANHEKLVSWLWNHIMDLQRDIASLQEERSSQPSPSKGETTPSPKRSREIPVQNSCLVPETPDSPRSECKTRIAEAEADNGAPVQGILPFSPSPAKRPYAVEEEPEAGSVAPARGVLSFSPSPSKRPIRHEEEPEAGDVAPPQAVLSFSPSPSKRPNAVEEVTAEKPDCPHAEEAASPIVSFSQRILQRKKAAGGDDAITPKQTAADVGDSQNSNSSDAATQPPSPKNGYAKLPMEEEEEAEVTEVQMAPRPRNTSIGSAVTPFRTEKKTDSEPISVRLSKSVVPAPAKRPVSAPARSNSVKGRLRKKQRRKRPRLQLNELAPEAEQMMDTGEDMDEGADLQGKRPPAKTPKPSSREKSQTENDSRRKRLSFASIAASPVVDKDSLAEFYPRRRRMSIDGQPAARAPSAPADKGRAEERVTKPASKSRPGSSSSAAPGALPRFDSFKTPAAVDKATRAAQTLFRQKEECAVKETVLGHARRGLIGYACHECEPFLRKQAAGHQDPEKEFKRLSEKFCKHRARQPPPGTPPDYWKLTFDETQTQNPNAKRLSDGR